MLALLVGLAGMATGAWFLVDSARVGARMARATEATFGAGFFLSRGTRRLGRGFVMALGGLLLLAGFALASK